MGVRQIQNVCSIVENDGAMLEQVFDLFADADKRVASNAAWVATHLDSEALASLQNRQTQMITLCMNSEDNITLRRLLLNLLERQTFTIDTIKTEFLDFCFEQMMSASVTAGVRMLCAKLAFKQCSDSEELMRELAQYADMLCQTDLPAAMRSILRRIKSKMPRHF